MVWIAKILDAAFLYVAALFAARLAQAITRQRLDRTGVRTGNRDAQPFRLGDGLGMEVTLSVALCLAGAYYHVAVRERAQG